MCCKYKIFDPNTKIMTQKLQKWHLSGLAVPKLLAEMKPTFTAG
jgi:hypothetical protein